MELELGLKITHTRGDDDDITTSMADFPITKDHSGPVFVSKETATKFILIAHLKGFSKENIGIEINEDGSRIAISGKKAVKEMELKGWIMQRKEMEIKEFRRVFRIPDGVILDKIEANFKNEDSELMIFMPKVVNGFCGVGIKEVKEEEMENVAWKEIRKESKETDQVVEIEKPVVARVPKEPKEEIAEIKIEGIQDSGQVEEQAIDWGPEMAEEFPGRDDGKETMKENPEESRELENAAKGVEESIQKESKEPEVEISEEKSHRKPEIEHRASVEKVGPQVMTEKVQERASLILAEQAEKEPIQPEETRREKRPEEQIAELGCEKQDFGPQISKSTESGDDKVIKQSEFASLPPTQDEEQHTTTKHYQVESVKPGELQKQEPITEIQELTKTEEPHQEPEPEVTQRNEIEEEENQPRDKAEEHESHDLEKQRGLNEAEAAQMKKNAYKKNHLVVAGSALLVSLIVIVFHLIRSKKR